MTDLQFKLYPYEIALSHSRILNTSQLGDFFWLELPHSKARFLALYEVSEVKSGSPSCITDCENSLSREGKMPWIKAESSLLNLSPGIHVYRFSFVDTMVDDIVRLYLSYHIQTDNPEKSSYIYMERNDQSNDSSSD